MARILLLMEHRQNRRLLAETLEPRHQILTPNPEALQDEFDLGIVDGVTLDRLRMQIQARKEAARPAFLPFLLVTPRQDVGQATRHLWKTIDELIITPIEKAELQARVEVLLQTRRLSLESEAWFRTIFYSIGPAVIATDRRGTIRQMNAEAERLTGWREAEAQGQPLEAVFHIVSEETHAPLENSVQRVLREGVAAIGLDSDALLSDRDGVERPIAGRGAPVRDGNGNIVGVVITFQDCSVKRVARRALQESEARFRRLAENAPDLIYRYEFAPQRGFSYVSPAATAITGYTPEEHYADPDLGLKLVHPDDRPLLEAYLQGGGKFHEPIVLRWVCKDGQIIWTEQRNVPIYDESGALVAMEGIARDVTARRQAEAKLAEQLDELRRWHAAVVGREERILELKHEVNELLRRLGEPIRYPSAEDPQGLDI